MATKNTGGLGRFVSAVFTALVAPITVSFVVHHMSPGEQPADGGQSKINERARAPDSSPEGHSQVIAEGVGRTPEDALQDALQSVLRSAVPTLVDAKTWAGQGPRLLDAVLKNNSGLVTGVQELRCSEEWHWGRKS